MLTDEEATRVVGETLVSADGEEVGEVVSVLTHAADNRAAWALVDADDHRVLVPLDEAKVNGDGLTVRYTAEQIRSAPEADDDTLDSEATDRLFEHYGIDDSVLRDDSGFATDTEKPDQGSSRDPRGTGADDAAQAHP
jgi:hypothetical protein